MVSPTPILCRALRRLALTTKQVNGGYYKGNRTGSMGRHTIHGGYRIDWEKVRNYVVPQDLEKFELTPFVTNKVPRAVGKFDGDPAGPMSGALYLKMWKNENGIS